MKTKAELLADLVRAEKARDDARNERDAAFTRVDVVERELQIMREGPCKSCQELRAQLDASDAECERLRGCVRELEEQQCAACVEAADERDAALARAEKAEAKLVQYAVASDPPWQLGVPTGAPLIECIMVDEHSSVLVRFRRIVFVTLKDAELGLRRAEGAMRDLLLSVEDICRDGKVRKGEE